MDCEDIINEGNELYIKLQETKHTLIDEKKAAELTMGSKHLLQKYMKYYAEKENDDPISEIIVNIIFNDIFEEHKKINRIVKMQNVIEELRKLKKHFCAISDLDTSMKYAKKLLEEANRFKDRLIQDRSNERFPDIFYELQVLIQRIKNAYQRTKTQVALESVSGVVTLGTAAVSGGLGIASSVLRGAAAPAAGTASAAASNGAKGAVETVNIVANVGEKLTPTVVNAGKATLKTGAAVLPTIASISSDVMKASEITKTVSRTLSISNFLFSRVTESVVEIDSVKSLRICQLAAKMNEIFQNLRKKLPETTNRNIHHKGIFTEKQIEDMASQVFLEFTMNEFE